MTTPLENLPEIRSYAARNDGSGLVSLDGVYVRLPEGVSTITIGSQNTNIEAHLSDRATSSARYATKRATAGSTIIFSNVAVPAGRERYLSASASSAGDVGATIITYPL